MTAVPPPKNRGDRPRVHATPELARQAARNRATARTQAHRKAKPERTIALTPERAALRQGLEPDVDDGDGKLSATRSTSSRKPGDAG